VKLVADAFQLHDHLFVARIYRLLASRPRVLFRRQRNLAVGHRPRPAHDRCMLNERVSVVGSQLQLAVNDHQRVPRGVRQAPCVVSNRIAPAALAPRQGDGSQNDQDQESHTRNLTATFSRFWEQTAAGIHLLNQANPMSRHTAVQLSLALLRLVSGFLFIQHGGMKLFGWFGQMPHAPEPFTLIWVAAVLEFFGGILILAGLFTRITAFILSGEMAYAYFHAHAPNGFSPIQNKGEPAVLFCFIYLFLAAYGGGEYSLDHWFKVPSFHPKRRKSDY